LQSIARDDPLLHRFAGDKVLLENALKASGCDIGVPGAVRIDHEDGPIRANPEAFRLGAHHVDSRLLYPLLHVVPKVLAFLPTAAIGTKTQEQVLPGFGDPRFVEPGVKFRVHLLRF